MNNFIVKATLAIAFSVCLLTSQANAVEKKVDCSKNQSLQHALDTAPTASGDIFYIQFDGTCVENITIRRDNTRINGSGTGVIIGTVRVFSVEGVWLNDLTISGPGTGIDVSEGEAILNGSTVAGNELDGILVRRHGTIWVRGGTVISENGRSGAYIDTGLLQAGDATFEDNSIDGILAVTGSKVTLNNTRIEGNQGAGVAVTFHSIVDIRNNTQIANNGYGGLGILARLDSGVWISGDENVVITDRIQCEDYESSFHTDHDWPEGWVYCSGF